LPNTSDTPDAIGDMPNKQCFTDGSMPINRFVPEAILPERDAVKSHSRKAQGVRNNALLIREGYVPRTRMEVASPKLSRQSFCV
jgi:hypothetical protein